VEGRLKEEEVPKERCSRRTRKVLVLKEKRHMDARWMRRVVVVPKESIKVASISESPNTRRVRINERVHNNQVVFTGDNSDHGQVKGWWNGKLEPGYNRQRERGAIPSGNGMQNSSKIEFRGLKYSIYPRWARYNTKRPGINPESLSEKGDCTHIRESCNPLNNSQRRG